MSADTPSRRLGATAPRGRRSALVSSSQPDRRSALGPLIVFAIALIAPPPGVPGLGAAEDRGLTIMEDQRRINSGYRDEFVLYKMVLVNSKGDRSERSLELRTLEGPEAGDKTLLIFRDPPDVRGTTLLTHENRGGDDDQWLYLPALRRSRRVGSSNKSSSFMGSELAYEDLAPNEVTKHQYKYLRDETLDGVPVWVIESMPRFKDSGYSRRELFVRQDNHQMARVNCYERKGQLLKVGRIENVQSGKSTLLEVIDVKIGNGYSPGDFSARALEG